MGKGRDSIVVLVLTVALTACYAGIAFASKQPALFLTIKSSNFGVAKLDHIQCGFLVVTDILISPDGVPLPFCNDNCVYSKKACLKVIASYGGSIVPSELFVFLSCDDSRRAAFVNNLIEFTLAHGFDGVDLSWLYPALQERDRYVRLLKELRHACDRHGLLLTVTVPSRPSVIEVNYAVDKLDKYADYVILSTTEFRKLRKTSFIAPLYSSSPGSSNSIDYHVDRWKLAGLSSSKIVIVIQTMTLTYKLYIQNEYRIGTPALQLKIRPYYKICRKLYSGSLEIWDNSAKSPYAFRDLSWYSYENDKSIKEKVGFVVQQGLAGIAVFYYDEDDPINICGDGQYPLTAIVVAAMQSEYLPPSVITDSQIYHFDPHPPLRTAFANGQAADKYGVPYDFYVEEGSDAYEQLPDVVTGDLYKTSPKVAFDANRQIGEMMEDASSLQPSSFEMMFDRLVLAEDEDEDASLYMKDVDMPFISSGSVSPELVSSSKPATMTDVQLYSELASGTADYKRSPLYSERPDSQRVVYTERCPSKNCPVRPCPPTCTHCSSSSPPSHPHKHCSIRIFATAHEPTTTTTTPSPMQFYTMAPATYRPPTCCQSCNSCIKLTATSGVNGSPETATPAPQHHHACPCHSAQLYSEPRAVTHLASVKQQVNPAIASAPSTILFQANTAAAQQIKPFMPYDVRVCPCDGILRDPHDKRSYYLCKRGSPMCDENKFTCAYGYIFDESSRKCVAERC